MPLPRSSSANQPAATTQTTGARSSFNPTQRTGGALPPASKGSGILDKLGSRLRTAHEKFKNETTTNGDTGLPAGIEGGVAQLSDCRFVQIKEGKEHAGEYTFYAAGIVKQPKIHNGQVVYGGRTFITEPMFDTPTLSRKTLDAHVQRVYEILRSLGINTREVSLENLETVMSALKNAKPHFTFRTWKGEKQKTGPYKDKEPRVQHQWGVLVDFQEEEHTGTEGISASNEPEIPGFAPEGYEEAPNGESVEYHGSTEEVAPQSVQSVASAPSGNGETGDGGAGEVATDVFNEFTDLQSLVEQATAEDPKAMEELEKMALASGLTEEDVENADSWQDVADMIITAAGSGEEPPTAAAEPEPFRPERGKVCIYTPIDKKTKKPSKKPVEVEPLAVDSTKKTADLKNLTNSKIIYKGIPWDRLTPVG